VLIAVFVPVAFMPGLTGRLYQQFAVTIAISVAFSAINALTLSPALASLLLKAPGDSSIAHSLASHGSDLLNQMEHGTEVNSLAIQLALAQAGLGLALVSALGASHPQAHGLRFVPLKPRLQREVFLMHPVDHPPDEATAVVQSAIRAALAQATLNPCVKRTTAQSTLSPKP